MVEVQKNLTLIVNNKARDRYKIKAAKIKIEAEKRGFSVNLIHTKSSAEAREALSGDITGVVGVIGGDGSVRTISDALLKKPNTTLESLPIVAALGGGTLNILRRETKIPRSPKGIVRAIEKGQYQRLDIGTVNIDDERQTTYVSSATVGFLAELFNNVDRSKNKRGFVVSALRIPKVIWNAEHRSALITVDTGKGKIERRANKLTDVISHNAGHLAFVPIGPKEKYDGGCTQIIIFDGKSEKARINAFRQLKGLVIDDFLLSFIRGRKPSKFEERLKGISTTIEVLDGKPIGVQADGDGLGVAHKKVVFGMTEQAIKILATDGRIKRWGGRFRKAAERVHWRPSRKTSPSSVSTE